MKKIKVIVVALAVLAGGAVLASAKSSSTIIANTASPIITNVAPLIWIDVRELPTSLFLNDTNLNSDSFSIVNTDNKGKITGVFNAIKDWEQGTNNAIFAQSSWFGTVKGTVKASKMGQPTVQMNISANGYSSPTTNLFILNTQNSSAGNASLKVNFKSTSAAVRTETNSVSSPFDAKVVGTSKINFKPGITAIQSQKTLTETADLNVRLYIEKTVDTRIVSYGTKSGVVVGVGNQTLAGTGSANKNNQFNVNLKDVNQSGSTLSLKGTLAGAVIISGGATNNIITLSTAAEKGKFQGQAVEGNGVFSGFND